MSTTDMKAHLDRLNADSADKRAEAARYRKLGDEYKSASLNSDDPDLARLQFDESSRSYAAARRAEREADDIDAIVAALTPKAQEAHS